MPCGVAVAVTVQTSAARWAAHSAPEPYQAGVEGDPLGPGDGAGTGVGAGRAGRARRRGRAGHGGSGRHDGWTPVDDGNGQVREGAWVADVTDREDLPLGAQRLRLRIFAVAGLFSAAAACGSGSPNAGPGPR